MSTGLIIDTEQLDMAAKALETINPGRASASHIRDMINANIRDGEHTYISTAGWVAYTWIDHNGSTHVRVSVEPYVVLKYLETRK